MDLEGKRFGRLKVLERAENRNRSIMWKCLCDCGSTKDVSQGSLINGSTQSCGCYNKERIHERCFQDLTGNVYGDLTVLYQAESKIRSGKARITWHCRCTCGNEKDVLAVELKNGHVKSCGQHQQAWNFKDLTGQKFDMLTVIRRLESRVKPSGNKIVRYECECECGSIVEVDGESLTSGHTKSCGCLKSAGERDVSLLLKELNVPFKREVILPDLLSPEGNPLRMDFELLETKKKTYIEFQGAQHYLSDDEVGSFGKLQRDITDRQKRNYCAENDFRLFEIKYNDNIEDKVKEIVRIAYDDTVPSSEEEKV